MINGISFAYTIINVILQFIQLKTVKEDIMNKIVINEKNNNLEIVSKLMNSVCGKYDCKVKFNPEYGTVDYTGDDTFRDHIAQETMNLFARD